eukprot:m.176149 g.176149  ORF g.176149 m.176149 type:complete len:529 (+) comp9957_c1_seq2:2131-3717(+)
MARRFLSWFFKKQPQTAELDPLLPGAGQQDGDHLGDEDPHSINKRDDGQEPFASPNPLHSQKLRYYSRLAPAHKSSHLVLPSHFHALDMLVVGGPTETPGTQSSLITILSLWNTMMGTSVLAMPWALNQAGFSLGICLMLGMATLACFTCVIVIRSGEGGRLNGEDVEFADVCRYYLGQRAYYIAIVFAIATFVGASIVYWVLMSSFLYNTINYFHDPSAQEGHSVIFHNATSNATIPSFTTKWDEVWTPTTAPIFLALLVFPLINFKSLTFFTKFNALGVVSIMYIILFVVSNAFIYADDSGSPVGGVHLSKDLNVVEFKGSFVMLTGVLSLSYFIHNGALSIMRNQRFPANNIRDLVAAYGLVCVTYLIVGLCFYVSFKGNKDDIRSNLLENFNKNNSNFAWALVAQLCLLFQMITVYPLLQYIVRFQVMTTFFGGTPWPSLYHVLGQNVIQTIICILVAIFFPKIGDILRYTGAGCGLAYVFALPALVQLEILRRKGIRSRPWTIICYVIIVIGLLNFVGQFVVS